MTVNEWCFSCLTSHQIWLFWSQNEHTTLVIQHNTSVMQSALACVSARMVNKIANVVHRTSTRLHFWKQMILCKSEADVTYHEKWHAQNPLFLSNWWRDCLLAHYLVCAFSWYDNNGVLYLLAICRRKAQILSDSAVDWQTLTVTSKFMLFWSFWCHNCFP